MAINVVCECGFSKQVPDSWKGRTVKCRCGRAFVVGHQDRRASTTGHAGTEPSRSHAPSWNPDLYPPGTFPPGTSAPEPAALVPSEPPVPQRHAPPPAIDREPPVPEDREPPVPKRHTPPPAIDREPPVPEDREPPAPKRHTPPPGIDRETPVPDNREPPASKRHAPPPAIDREPLAPEGPEPPVPPRPKTPRADREPAVPVDREPRVPKRPEPWPAADGGLAERDEEPSPAAAGTAILPEDDSSSAVARHRSRRRAARRKKGPLLASLAFLALLGIAGAVYVIIEKPFSAKIVQAVPSPPVAPQEPRSEGRAGEAERAVRPKTPRAGARRVGDPIELVPDDGLLLTGMFGDYAEELALSEEQQQQISKLTEQLRGKEGELRARKLTVEQWMTDGQAVAAELLAVLNDEQRSRLQVSLQRGSIVRTAMVDYGAQIRPELSIPRTEWALNRDRGRFLPVEKSSITGPAGYGCYRSAQATGGFAVTREFNRGESRRSIDVWNLSEDRLVGRCEIQTKGMGSGCLVSRDARHFVFDRTDERGAAIVEIWSVENGSVVGSKEIPRVKDGAGAAAYTLTDCVAGRAFCMSRDGYWAWDFSTDEVVEIGFPEWVTDTSLACDVSPGGRYLAASHMHTLTMESKQYHVLEVCMYEFGTGKLLGNQILEKEYRKSTVSAMAFSHDGAELAILWDFGPENPGRSLVRFDATNGETTLVVDGLPPATEGYAHRHDLKSRDLIWLPENAGWVVNLQKVVDAETGAIIDLPLPTLQQAAEAGQADAEVIVDAIPAPEERLLLIIQDGKSDPANPQLRTESVELPQLGPFM